MIKVDKIMGFEVDVKFFICPRCDNKVKVFV